MNTLSHIQSRSRIPERLLVTVLVGFLIWSILDQIMGMLFWYQLLDHPILRQCNRVFRTAGMLGLLAVPLLPVWIYVLHLDLHGHTPECQSSPWHALAILIVPVYGWLAIFFTVARAPGVLFRCEPPSGHGTPHLTRWVRRLLLSVAGVFGLITLGLLPFNLLLLQSPLGLVFGSVRDLIRTDFTRDFPLQYVFEYVPLLAFLFTLVQVVRNAGYSIRSPSSIGSRAEV